MTTPVEYPEGMGPGTYDPSDEEEDGIASVGEYTKQTSGITEIDYLKSYLN